MTISLLQLDKVTSLLQLVNKLVKSTCCFQQDTKFLRSCNIVPPKPSLPIVTRYVDLDCSVSVLHASACSHTSFASRCDSWRRQATAARRRMRCALERFVQRLGTNVERLTCLGAKIWSCCKQEIASDWTIESGWFCMTEAATKQADRRSLIDVDVSKQ